MSMLTLSQTMSRAQHGAQSRKQVHQEPALRSLADDAAGSAGDGAGVGDGGRMRRFWYSDSAEKLGWVHMDGHGD